MCASDDVARDSKVSAGAIDHSYGFLWWEKRDVWFDLVNDPRKIRYNGWVDRHGGNMVHGHPNNGTKAWIWGTSPVEKFWYETSKITCTHHIQTPYESFSL